MEETIMHNEDLSLKAKIEGLELNGWPRCTPSNTEMCKNVGPNKYMDLIFWDLIFLSLSQLPQGKSGPACSQSQILLQIKVDNIVYSLLFYLKFICTTNHHQLTAYKFLLHTPFRSVPQPLSYLTVIHLIWKW